MKEGHRMHENAATVILPRSVVRLTVPVHVCRMLHAFETLDAAYGGTKPDRPPPKPPPFPGVPQSPRVQSLSINKDRGTGTNRRTMPRHEYAAGLTLPPPYFILATVTHWPHLSYFHLLVLP